MKKIVCIDPNDSSGDLICGQFYDVEEEYLDNLGDLYYRITINNSTDWWRSYRFNVLFDNGLPDNTSIVHNHDNVKILSKECACGIFRNDCDYHKTV